ncbi:MULTISPECIES: metabolite traffic protein EboE [unclassified Marinovum]
MDTDFWRQSGLTYCANIHPAETLPQVLDAIRGPMARVGAALTGGAGFPVGLRLSARSLADLTTPEKRQQLAAALSDNGLVPISMNGFPYGPFHGTRVKEDVYLPDWRARERLVYTCGLADLMAELAGQGGHISLSTVPGAFKTNGLGNEAEMAANFVAAALHCAKVEATTGCRVDIAIEPEPCCFLETIDEAVAFFGQHLFGPAAVTQAVAATGLGRDDAEALLRRHLGLCYDVCHAAVEFEDPADSVALLRGAGIAIPKLQISAALRVPVIDATTRAALEAYAEPTYLHQVVSRRADGTLARHVDLAPALARGAEADGEEWRVHFHVPIFLSDLGAFQSTQAFLQEILALHRADPISPHLEVETYTWGVLPEGLRGATIEEDIIRELTWVRDALT